MPFNKNLFTLLVIASNCIVTSANAQGAMGNSYRTAIGVKFYPGSFSIKHFVKPNKAALEGLAYFWGNGARFTGLYEIHGDIEGARGLKWYIGPGAHIGFWSDSWKRNNPNRDAGAVVGIDGVLGLDFKIKNIPLNISADWQPSFNITGYSYFEAGWGGLGVRYTIK
jgi:hypothetical protein